LIWSIISMVLAISCRMASAWRNSSSPASGQRHAAPGALQQLLAHLGLQLLDLAADGRLGHVQQRLGGGQAAQARHMEKVEQPFGIEQVPGGDACNGALDARNGFGRCGRHARSAFLTC
jgi:hypothetical protein